MISRFDHTQQKTQRARELRQDAPRPEQRLWFHLRSAQMDGFSFRRQHPVGPYFLDFYCAKAKLAIELDGDQHGADRAISYDLARTRFLESKGICVLRFPNDALREDFPLVLDTIAKILRERCPHSFFP